MSASIVEAYIGVERTFQASADLIDLLEGDHVYPWKVPAEKPLNYISFPVPEEGPLKLVWNKKLSEGAIQISIWTSSMIAAAKIWEVVERLLTDVTIVIAAGVVITGTPRLIHIIQDSNDDTIYQGIVRYEWQSWTM